MSGSTSRQHFTSISTTPRRTILTHPVQTADWRKDQNDLLYIAGHIEECEQEDSSNRSISRVQQPRNMASVKKDIEVNSRFFYVIWSRALAFKGSFTSLAHAYSLFTLHVRVVLRANFILPSFSPMQCWYGNRCRSIFLFLSFLLFLALGLSLSLSPGLATNAACVQ